MRLLRIAIMLLLSATMSCGKDRVIGPTVIGDEILFYARSAPDTTFTHLFAVNADGSGLHKLTDTDMHDRSPRWSPDGTRIVFLRQYHRQTFPDSVNVTVMNAEGTNIIRLTNDEADANPSWSSDGTQIAYQNGTYSSDVWRMDADGSSPHLYMSADSTNFCGGIGLTPQNTLLGATFSGLWMQLTPSATSLTRVAGAQVISPGGVPRISPDGSRIAFEYLGYTSTEPVHIVTVKTDGSDWKGLTEGGQYSPVWSPDGARIAYVHDRRVWIMNANGSSQRPIPMRQGVYVVGLGDWK